MVSLSEIRKKYPQYNDLSDQDLATALHTKFYADMPFSEFSQKIGLAVPSMGEVPPVPEIPGRVQAVMGREQFLPSAGGFSELAPNARELMELRERGMTGTVEPGLQPAVNPLESAVPTSVGTGISILRQGGRIVPTLVRAASSGATAGAVDVPLGTFGEEVSRKYPILGMALPPALGIAIGDPFARRVMQPGGTLRPGGERVQRWVEEYGAGPRPSSYIESGPVRVMEQTAALFPGGKLTQQMYAKKLETKMNEAVENLKTALPRPGETKEIAGVHVTEGVATAKRELGLNVENSYKQFLESLTPAGAPRPTGEPWEGLSPGTSEWMRVWNEISGDTARQGQMVEYGRRSAFTGVATANLSSHLTEKTLGELAPEVRGYVEKYLPQIREGRLSPKDMHDFQKGLWAATPKDRRARYQTGLVFDAFKRDLVAHDARWDTTSMDAFQAAQDAYKLKRSFEASPTLKAIARTANQNIEQVIYQTFREGNLRDVNVLRNHMDPESWNIARSRFLENLLEASEIREGLERKFNPAEFARLVEKYDRQLANVFPQEVENIRDFAALCKASVKDIELARQPFLKAMTVPGAVTGAGRLVGLDLTGGINIAGNITAVGLTNELMRPRGTFRRWFGRTQRLYKK